MYKVKYYPDGTVDRLGYTQLHGVDYHDTFSPVAKITIVRCLLSIATVRNWLLYQMDVTNAFLQGDLDEEIYMALPQGFRSLGELHNGLRSKVETHTKVIKLTTSLYYIKQASRRWNIKFAHVMNQVSFFKSNVIIPCSLRKRTRSLPFHWCMCMT